MKRQTTLWLVAGIVFSANMVWAGTGPVFRHAIEQWPAREVYLTVGLANTSLFASELTDEPLAPVPPPPSVPTQGTQTSKGGLPKHPGAPTANPIPAEPPAPKKTLLDKIPFFYVAGTVMAGWIGFLLYRLKQEYDCHQREKKENEQQ